MDPALIAQIAQLTVIGLNLAEQLSQLLSNLQAIHASLSPEVQAALDAQLTAAKSRLDTAIAKAP